MPRARIARITRRPTSRPASGPGRLRLALVAGTIASILAITGTARAQPQPTTSVSPASVRGSDFAGLRLPLETQDGRVSFDARRAWAWTSGTTRRLLLTGDVRVRVGSYDLNAKRACVWIEPVAGEEGVFQVYAYLDRVGTPEDAVGSLSVSAERLRVGGILRPEAGGLTLRADDLVQGRPPSSGDDGTFVAEGEAAFARALRRLIPGYVEQGPADPQAALPKPLSAERRLESAVERGPTPPVATREEIEEYLSRVPLREANEPIFSKGGVVSISAGATQSVSGPSENSVIVSGGVVVQYTDTRQGPPRNLEISAQRGVVFLKGGKMGDVLAGLAREDVLGIYLEGDVVATDGQYTLRAPKVFYDLERNKAMVVDAVFWTYDERRKLPLYVRARAFRQESADEFSASGARFANTAFFEPELSVGATSLTIKRREVATIDAQTGQAVAKTKYDADARNITLRADGVPFFYWPIFRGDPADLPLRDFRLENASGSGATIKTRWNAYSLLGIEKPEWLSADLLLDGYFERGLGVGGKVAWDRPRSKGNVFAYTLPADTGTDVYRTGFQRERDGEFRGILLGENRWTVDRNWTVQAEVAYVSDEGLVDAIFPELGAERRELANRLLLRRREGNSAFTLEGKATLNDFVANEYLLQTPGYAVTKLPEARYIRVADDLLPNVEPGLVTYSSDSRLGYLALAFDEQAAINRGFGNDNGQRAFGINSTQSIAERLRAAGLDEAGVLRFDTRHEVSANFREGPVNIQPFGVLRGTFYDRDFAAFNAGDGNDSVRYWGGGGVRVGTAIQRVDNNIDSRFFDIHRLRHIVEPNATFFAAGTNVGRERLPVYDDGVENLVDGGMMRLGLNQTFQTQRGGPGRWHSVDVLKLNTDFTFATSDATRKSPIGRFLDFRPEMSNPGDFWSVDAAWQVSDTLAITGANIFDLEEHQQARTSAGAIVRHSPSFTSYVDLHYLNAQDSTVIATGAQYELTRKYSIGLGASYDASVGGWQGGSLEVRRRFQSIVLGGSIAYDNIAGQTSFGFVIQPFGTTGAAQIAGFGSASPVSRVGGY